MSNRLFNPAPTALRSGGMIDGVRLKRLVAHEDDRGSFTEFFSKDWTAGDAPAQWSSVASAAGMPTNGAATSAMVATKAALP